MEVPFKRIAMDIVGPLPRTVRGNKFILVICYYATKYPEAVPLKTIDSETVANEVNLVHVKSWYTSRNLNRHGQQFQFGTHKRVM